MILSKHEVYTLEIACIPYPITRVNSWPLIERRLLNWRQLIDERRPFWWRFHWQRHVFAEKWRYFWWPYNHRYMAHSLSLYTWSLHDVMYVQRLYRLIVAGKTIDVLDVVYRSIVNTCSSGIDYVPYTCVCVTALPGRRLCDPHVISIRHKTFQSVVRSALLPLPGIYYI